jgi:hypothetical protein
MLRGNARNQGDGQNRRSGTIGRAFLETSMSDDIPLLGFAQPRFHAGRNTSVRRGERWQGVSVARLQLGRYCWSAPLALQTERRCFNTLTAYDLRDEHDLRCRTPDGLLAVMQQLYPGFQVEEIVTLVHFQLD